MAQDQEVERPAAGRTEYSRVATALKGRGPFGPGRGRSRRARADQRAEASGVAGIYVYTLPHYLRYPFDPDTGKTMLKVGHSSKDAHYRATSQGRLTALPEDPILLRIYPADESVEVEKSSTPGSATPTTSAVALVAEARNVRHLDEVPRSDREVARAGDPCRRRVRGRRGVTGGSRPAVAASRGSGSPQDQGVGDFRS